MSNGDGNLPMRTNNAVVGWQIYLAAAFGALSLGFGDLMKNGKAATVLKVSEVIQEHLLPGFGAGALIALFVLAALGIGYCWIYGPSTLVDGFNRGFSVFALLAVTASSNQVPAGLASSASTNSESQATLGILRSAYAQGNPILDIKQSAEQGAPLGQAIIQLSPLTDKQDVPVTTVTVRDAQTRKVTGLEQVRGATFNVRRTPGHYILEVETPGYRRTEVELKIDDQINAYALPMNQSALPLSIQRLYGVESSRLEELPPAERYKQIGIAYFKSKDYENAIRYYDKALNEQADDAQLYNFKGYALFRTGKYDYASETLQAATRIDPTYFMARLNSAKIYCAKKSPELAIDVLTREPRLSKDHLRTTLQDGEFRRVCRSTIAELDKRM